MLTSIESARLRKVVALYDSPLEAEAMAAFRATLATATRFGSTPTKMLAAILTPVVASGRREVPMPAAPAQDWHRKVALCRDVPHVFSQWERDFLTGIDGRRSISAKQTTTLNALHDKAARHFAAGGDA